MDDDAKEILDRMAELGAEQDDRAVRIERAMETFDDAVRRLEAAAERMASAAHRMESAAGTMYAARPR